jgi:hypothetical protein
MGEYCEKGTGSVAFCRAPLWPAGHLPRKGGDQSHFLFDDPFYVAKKASPMKQLISPLAGEMAGRPEGGVVERQPSTAST